MLIPKSVCVYCGSANSVNQGYFAAARRLGTLLGERGIQVVYGGGRVGLMGAVADAARSAGGRVVGIIPQHLQEREVGHLELDELVVVDNMHTRKRLMVERSDAFVVLPGGLGTLDETFEILTWKQLQLHDKPVVVVNVDGYWDRLESLIEHMITEGFVYHGHRSLMTVVASVDEVLSVLALAPESALPVASDQF